MAIERRQAITAVTWRATDPYTMDAAAQRFVGVTGLIAMVASLLGAVLPFSAVADRSIGLVVPRVHLHRIRPLRRRETYTYFAFALGGIWRLLMSIVLIFRPVGKAAMSVST